MVVFDQLAKSVILKLRVAFRVLVDEVCKFKNIFLFRHGGVLPKDCWLSQFEYRIDFVMGFPAQMIVIIKIFFLQ